MAVGCRAALNLELGWTVVAELVVNLTKSMAERQRTGGRERERVETQGEVTCGQLVPVSVFIGTAETEARVPCVL